MEGKEEGVIGKMVGGSVNWPESMSRETWFRRVWEYSGPKKKKTVDWHGMACPACPAMGRL